MKVITDLPFLDAFCRKLNQQLGYTAVDSRLRILYAQFLNLLNEGAIVHCLGLGPNLEKYNNPLLLALNLQNRLRPLQANEISSAMDIRAVNPRKDIALFCLGAMPEQVCKQAGAETGYWVLHKPPEKDGFFDYQVQTYNRHSAKSWKFAAGLFQPHHTLVIADAYLYNEYGAKGLLALLKQIKPACLGYPYWITLLGSDSNRPKSFGLFQGEQIQQLVEKIELLFADTNIPFQVEAFVYNGGEFHDRYILTNNLCVLPGYGVSIVKDGKEVPAKEGTWTAAKPFSRVVYNGQQGVYYEKVMREKLGTIKQWIMKGGGASAKNPLLNN